LRVTKSGQNIDMVMAIIYLSMRVNFFRLTRGLILAAAIVLGACSKSVPPPASTVSVPAPAAKVPTVDQLVAKIKEQLPEGWSVEWKPDQGTIQVSRDAKAEFTGFPNDNGPTSEEMIYMMFLQVQDLVPPEQREQWLAENQKVQQQLTAMEATMGDLQAMGDYEAKTPADERQVTAYHKLKAQLYEVPQYYFQDLSLTWTAWRPKAVDDRVEQECEAARQKVWSVLTPYPAANITSAN
jgi:hypothetical protein